MALIRARSSLDISKSFRQGTDVRSNILGHFVRTCFSNVTAIVEVVSRIVFADLDSGKARLPQ
jgi:hypothetical protein